MKNNEKYGFGDVLVYSVLLLLAMKWTGILTASWTAIYNFSVFVLIYLAVYFVIELAIAIVAAVIKKREE
jgi:hypothetical protein